KLGYDIKLGEDIENAIKNLSGTHIANLEPNHHLGTLLGISTWPEIGNNAGYICSVNSNNNSILINPTDITDMELDTPSRSYIIFVPGWALQENLKGLLEVIFHSGATNAKLKMDATEMHVELLQHAKLGEIEYQDVLKVSTIANWIKRTSRAIKQ
ncbi:31098_t:CDS:2, partial [Gigaspora margarita]